MSSGFCGTVTVVLATGGEVWSGEPVSGGPDPGTVVLTERRGGGALCPLLVGLMVVGFTADLETVVMVGCGTAPPPAEGVVGCSSAPPPAEGVVGCSSAPPPAEGVGV